MRTWTIGITGTFDVENYGDLLFPLIARFELAKRLGDVRVIAFSYHRRQPPEWPYEVTPLSELPRIASTLDGMLIGGGLMIRFDQAAVAPGYSPGDPAILHPTGYWLTPALIAAQHGVPLIWNAPGVFGETLARWAEPLMEVAFAASSYICVRDEPSRHALSSWPHADRVVVVPDTGFGIGRMLNGEPSPEFRTRCAGAGLSRRYIVVQATPRYVPFLDFVRRHASYFRDFQFLALPIGPLFGERGDTLKAKMPDMITLPDWPYPLELAEMIQHADAVIGHSFHLAVTAAAAGVPVFTTANLDIAKYVVLRDCDGVFRFDLDAPPTIEWFLDRVGKTDPGPSIHARTRQLVDHWDRVADHIRSDRDGAARVVSRSWQVLPGRMAAAANRMEEEAARRQAEADRKEAEAARKSSLLQDALASANSELQEHRISIARQQGTIDELRRLIGLARADIESRDRQVRTMHESRSWRLTEPLRSVRRWISDAWAPARPGVMDLARIAQTPLRTDPYSWAVIEHLFSAADAAALATTFPRDHFKTIAANDGEKIYRYEARSLISMGGTSASHPEELSRTWRSLAADLLSPAYRRAMSLLVGMDLTTAPLEVNVFHYGGGSELGPHLDLPDKMVTQTMYFNTESNVPLGGCLRILQSKDIGDVAAEVDPIVGNSAVLVRSATSWHAVTPVAAGSASRRSLTATFYRPGAPSTMWPPGDTEPLHRYDG